MATVAPAARGKRKAKAPVTTPVASLHPAKALVLPLAFILALAALGSLPSIHQNPRLLWAVLGAAGALLVGWASVLASARAQGRSFGIDVALRRPHYLQACIQTALLLYWGHYWAPVYAQAPLFVAQLLFAYAFDMLLVWARRDTYVLGFGPFPVILSIQFFLWFKPDWYYLQFLMVALGFAAKEFIRWEKDGRSAHIFNPSSFPLAIFSIAMILTGTTSMTYGVDIARTEFNPPNIYLVLFFLGLPGQFLFGVTTMTMSAIVTTYLFSVAYFLATGTYFFVDSYIPIAVFLGMHLLFTDPATAPRTELGRVIFGVLYGIGNIVLYWLLERAGVPSFYDKLLPVPLLNVSIKLIDRIAESSVMKSVDPARIATSLVARRRNLAYMTVWASIFVVMFSTNAVGDSHPGHRVPFWQNACQQNLRNGCKILAEISGTYCQDGSGWACNELGVLRSEGRVENAQAAARDFRSGCALGFQLACQNEAALGRAAPRRGPPSLQDYPVILRTGKGPLPDRTPLELYARACDQGWMVGCESVGAANLQGVVTPRNPSQAAAEFLKACDGGLASACSNLGVMYHNGDGILRDQDKALGYMKKACDLGYPSACELLKHENQPATR